MIYVYLGISLFIVLLFVILLRTFHFEPKAFPEMKKNYENVELKFIDVQKDSYEEHDDAVNMLNQHMKLPYTKINGQMTYYGSLSKEFICEDIEDILLKR